jgi:hypothetical protein
MGIGLLNKPIQVEVVVENGFVDVLAISCDAGIRHDER